MTVWSEDDCVARPRVGASARIVQSTPKFKSRFHEAIEESGRRTENVVFPDGSQEERPYLDCRLPPFFRRPKTLRAGVLARETMQIARFPFLFSSVFLHLPPSPQPSLASPRAARWSDRRPGQRRWNSIFFLQFRSEETGIRRNNLARVGRSS